MNAVYWAALGSRRGAGESLASWLRAGPLGVQAIDAPATSALAGAQLYCPACRVDEAGRRRWYTREDWPEDGVVCTTHALPLLRLDAPPTRLRSRRWSPILRDEFRDLGAWTQRDDVGDVRRPIVRAICARSDPRVPYSRAWAEAQWHLWATEWPVPVAPRLPSRGSLVPMFQFDRLALMAIAHRVYSALDSEQGTGWPALPIRSRVLHWLEGRLGRVRPCWRPRVARYFRDITKSVPQI
jgi:hypothetical protein